MAAVQAPHHVKPYRQLACRASTSWLYVRARCGAQSALPLTLMMPVLSTSSVGFVFRKNAYCAPSCRGSDHGSACVWPQPCAWHRVQSHAAALRHSNAHLVCTGVGVCRVGGRVLVQLHPARAWAQQVLGDPGGFGATMLVRNTISAVQVALPPALLSADVNHKPT